MPTYQYSCRECGRSLEARQEFSDSALTVCPTCGGALRKQYGSVGVTFNGSGFYRTDSRADGTAKSTAAASSASGGDSATPKAKPETKAASTTSTASTAPTQ